jgi:SAM-dependent methyltransferase
MGTYVFDNSWGLERERLAGLEMMFDPGTTRHFEALGVGPGWSCLEAGGGGGSIAQWLCRRVGPAGKVVATDIDTRFLDALVEPNLEVLRHDLTADELPEDTFDLIHARLLLEHFPSREVTLKRMVAALKPGGWVLLEDADWGPFLSRPPYFFMHPPSRQRHSAKVWRAALKVMASAGYDAEYGRRLPLEFMNAGLIDIGAETRATLQRGGSPQSLTPRWTLERLRPLLVSAAGLTDRDVDREITGFADPELVGTGPYMVSAWGRRVPTGAAAAPRQMPSRAQGAVDRLRLVPLFEACDDRELERIAALAGETEAAQGEVLTAEGTPGASFYVIATGTASVTRQGRKLATLGPGAFFGEVALLTHGLRTATVTADTPMRLYMLDEQSFRSLIAEAPTVGNKVLEGLAERLRQADEALTE